MELGTFSISLAVKDLQASRQFYEKLGFTREGVLRSLVERRGRRWDVIMYSLLRADCEQRQTRGRPG